jgi:hypothetical protein
MPPRLGAGVEELCVGVKSFVSSGRSSVVGIQTMRECAAQDNSVVLRCCWEVCRPQPRCGTVEHCFDNERREVCFRFGCWHVRDACREDVLKLASAWLSHRVGHSG